MTYLIKCSECRADMGETDSLAESAAGGRCDDCSNLQYAKIAAGQVSGLRLVCVQRVSVSNAEGMARVYVHMTSGRKRRTASITYYRRSDTYSMRVTTMTGRSARSMVTADYDLVYADQFADLLTAGGFDGALATR